jgi:hypothetical protein
VELPQELRGGLATPRVASRSSRRTAGAALLDRGGLEPLPPGRAWLDAILGAPSRADLRARRAGRAIAAHRRARTAGGALPADAGTPRVCRARSVGRRHPHRAAAGIRRACVALGLQRGGRLPLTLDAEVVADTAARLGLAFRA